MFHFFGENGQPQNGESIERALDRSAHELQLLANFYHQHSYPERAQEIYRTIMKIRRDRDRKRAS
jgi:hypothetical protein